MAHHLPPDGTSWQPEVSPRIHTKVEERTDSIQSSSDLHRSTVAVRHHPHTIHTCACASAIVFHKQSKKLYLRNDEVWRPETPRLCEFGGSAKSELGYLL